MSEERSAAGSKAAVAATAGASAVLLTLASGQFLMTLDSSVMNVSIATVAEDIGTTVSGIQTAITLYTLVMAALMITGGKLGSILGRRRAFAFGCVIYGAGSLTTALAPNLAVLLFGWSLLEGIGAALIMPSIVALVAANFGPADRPRAYGIVASAGAIAVAVGPLIGGLATTYASWRWVFAGEVLVVMMILAFSRRIASGEQERRADLDVVGAVMSASGLALIVFGVLRSGVWGWVQPKADAPSVLGISAVTWLVFAGVVVLWLLTVWERHVVSRGREPLVDLALFENRQMTGGLSMFFFQFLVQAGVFFTIPLFLSVVLGLTAFETGVRLVPLSLALLVAAAGIPRVRPRASPRRVVRAGLMMLAGSIVVLVGALEVGAGPEVVTIPLILAGLGIGALASQLGAVTVSALPDERSGEVGGLQNTATNLGASLGTALAGSVLIAALTASFLAGIQQNPAISDELASTATVRLADGIPFLSDEQVRTALTDAGLSQQEVSATVDENEQARLEGLRAALAMLGLIALVGLFFSNRVPDEPIGADPPRS
jgi:EmrB/QacA subfamily drug resistance transporter